MSAQENQQAAASLQSEILAVAKNYHIATGFRPDTIYIEWTESADSAASAPVGIEFAVKAIRGES